ncbi:MAG TPA: hypothetical protein VK154_05315 [Chitinophagales bacterium]|nr:hypothetical protein [Chitinophagales bacterium]
MRLSEQGVVREEALLAYLNNELSVEDKQQLEKLLEEDPFAQEALEGLKESGKVSAAAAVVNINKKVRERVGIKDARMVKMHWSTYAWAAVVLGLLIGVGFVMVTYMGNKQEGQMAMNEPAKQEGVNLLEEKKETPNIVSTEIVTDTLAPALESQPVAESGTMQMRDENTNTSAKPEQLSLKGTSGAANGSSTNMGAVVSPGTYTMNSTILADDKGTAPAPKPTTNVARTESKPAAANGARENVSLESVVTSSKYEKKASEQNLKAKDKQVAGYTTQTVVRGSIMEKEEVERVSVVTMDEAMKSFNSQDYKKSSDQFTEILKQQPNNADALYFGGISDYINGNTKKSEKNFDKLLKEGTKFNEGSKWYKANILLKKGKRDEAKKLLDELSNSGGSYKERAIKKKAEIEF